MGAVVTLLVMDEVLGRLQQSHNTTTTAGGGCSLWSESTSAEMGTFTYRPRGPPESDRNLIKCGHMPIWSL